jgi:hypothetical protein
MSSNIVLLLWKREECLPVFYLYFEVFIRSEILVCCFHLVLLCYNCINMFEVFMGYDICSLVGR